MRTIDEIIVHCTATKEGADYHVSDIDKWHRALGWDGCGYHFVIALDGSIEIGRPLEKAGAHCSGHNARSIGVAYVGGLASAGRPADTRTAAQRESLAALMIVLKRIFKIKKISGHNEYAAKACPCFDVKSEFDPQPA